MHRQVDDANSSFNRPIGEGEDLAYVGSKDSQHSGGYGCDSVSDMDSSRLGSVDQLNLRRARVVGEGHVIEDNGTSGRAIIVSKLVEVRDKKGTGIGCEDKLGLADSGSSQDNKASSVVLGELDGEGLQSILRGDRS